MLELQLRIAGVLLLTLGVMNTLLPQHFGWRREMQAVSLLTRQIFFVHHLFIIVIVAMFGQLSLLATDTLLAGGRLGAMVLGGMAVFWLLRLMVQLWVYDTALWRGDRFRTAMHGVFTCLWAYFTIVFGYAALRAMD